jgi:hypothetical protein
VGRSLEMRTHQPVPPLTVSGDAPAQSRPRGTAESGPTHLLGLQQLAGNRAVASMLAGATVQRDKPSNPPSKPPAGKSIELIFIIRKPNDQFIKQMTDYVTTTLKGHVYREVANVEDICAEATKLAAQGITLSKVRIVSHAQRDYGGVGMTPAKEKKWRYVQPDEVKAYMSTPECKGLRRAMAKNAEVEFWGCWLGGVQEASQVWADLFGKRVRSTKAEMMIREAQFKIGRKKGVKFSKDVVVKSSEDVPARFKTQFREWLLKHYRTLRDSGEAPVLKTDDEQEAHMTELFNRSKGRIPSRVVQEKGSPALSPGEVGELDLWETVQPNQ